jgi:hypothetical protein
MRKTLLFTLFLLLSVGWMLAQQTPRGKSNSNANETTIQGCLTGSGGSYTLTDKSGKTYQLQGDTAKLSDHIGHEVRVIGSESTAAPGSQGATSTTGTTTEAKAKFNVTKMEHVSASCSTAQK